MTDLGLKNGAFCFCHEHDTESLEKVESSHVEIASIYPTVLWHFTEKYIKSSSYPTKLIISKSELEPGKYI